MKKVSNKLSTIRSYLLVLGAASLALASAALAHPEDKDPVSRVGVGSSFVALADINIKPGQSLVFFMSGKNIESYDADGLSTCYLQLYSVSERDRRIPKGTAFNIEAVSRDNVRVVSNRAEYKGKRLRATSFYFKSSNLYLLGCRQVIADDEYAKLKSSDLFEMTIGEMKAHLAEQFELKLATPEDIKGVQDVENITQ